MTMGDRIAVMKDGILQQVDSSSNIYNHPTNMFVAGFIGSSTMNCFAVQRVERGRKAYLQLGRELINLNKYFPKFFRDTGDRSLTLSIRPENIYHPQYLHPKIQGFKIRSVVNLIEMMGNELIVYLKTQDHLELVARLDSRVKVRPGEFLDLLFDTQRIYLFYQNQQTI